MSAPLTWIPAPEAAHLLGVSRATLYAYVSRGLVHSQAMPGPSRARAYAREDVERLRRRAEERRSPDKVAARALQWGMPVLESAIAMIDGHRLYYRGVDATTLARTASIAQVASSMWAVAEDARPRATGRAVAMRPPGSLPFVPRAQMMLAAAAAADAAAVDRRPAAVASTGWRILRLLAHAAIGRDPGAATIDEALARAWRLRRGDVDVVRAALILCADHELNISTFTARCVASAGSHPYAVVGAALAALEGPKHGGASARTEAMLDAVRRSRPVRAALAGRLRRGETIDGVGHPLYHDGDPRAAFLLNLLRERHQRDAECRYVTAVARAAEDLTGHAPNLDFGLAAVARVLRLPAGAPLTLFAIGRTIGWIGHAIEQYANGQLIRPRARYVGVVPGSAS